MSFSNLSLYANSNLPQSAQGLSIREPSAQTSDQAQQSASSTFEAMLSTFLQEDSRGPLAQRDLMPPDLNSVMKQLQQHPLDLLSPQMRESVKALDEASQPSAIAAPVPTSPLPSSRITWSGGTLTETELQIVAVLNRHKDQCPLSWQSLADKANDPSTPPDLKVAIEGLQQDPELFYAIGSQGDGRCGGKITAKDLSGFSEHHSQVGEFQGRQAQSYEQNYIPSDGTGNGQPQVMAVSDAMRELYRYSDYLPKNLSLADFKQIVEGDAKTGKCPPQVIAAAQYFLNHPDAWRQLYGGAIDKVHKEDFLQVASSAMSLTKPELAALDTINKNQSAFFGSGDLTREKLASMADDKGLNASVRKAASQLLSDPLAFGLLNNTITGYKTHHGFFDFGGGHTVDSGNISNNDFRHFYNNMSAANSTVQNTKTHVPKTPAEQDAVADMMMGVADQPNIKSAQKNGGAFMHAADSLLKVGSEVLDWAATAVGLLSFVPVLGELADVVSMGLETESQAANLLHTATSGGNMKLALAEAGINLGGQALSFVAGPEVKLAIHNGLVKKALEESLTAGVNMPISVAQTYAEGYLSNIKARLEAMQGAGAPTQYGTTAWSQNVA
ncbi:HrpF/NolX family T3SS translocon protein [Rhizobium leguminosarum]|uniref:HrpF/NolX family T3SS translocon protein n=1 Tax=Rhizobium leguminosarum TaxID=384 RepID=UPI001AE57926|nr:HrpF/NolX family T3SS translocon protein [Rhizobium leguminosarum]MBP2449504.1 type III secretion translocon protein HrpF [Rhizobium leguminosarum]